VPVETYQDLIVWQKAMRLAAEAYRLSKLMPRSEQFRLVSQLLRAAASVPANIAEGHSRGSRKDYANFVSIARGSLAETETLLMLAIDVELLQLEEVEAALALAQEISKMLRALHARLREPLRDPSSARRPLKPNP
jgi:four helix bundle protein